MFFILSLTTQNADIYIWGFHNHIGAILFNARYVHYLFSARFLKM